MSEGNDINNVLFDACENATPDVVEFIVKQYPSLLSRLNSKNDTALHVACEQGMVIEGIKCIYNAYPDALKLFNNDGASPLHLTIAGGKSLDTLIFLYEKLPNALSTQNGHGDLPLHWISEDTEEDLVSYMVKAYPRGAAMKNIDGAYP